MGATQTVSRAQPVPNIDLTKYIGPNKQNPMHWYELMSKPTWFAKNMINASAYYYFTNSTQDQVQVINYAERKDYSSTEEANRQQNNKNMHFRRGRDRKVYKYIENRVTGTGVVAPCKGCQTPSNARLSVKFSVFQPTENIGNYIILALATNPAGSHYQYSLVSNASGSMVWILGQNKYLPPGVEKHFKTVLTSQGISLDGLIRRRDD